MALCSDLDWRPVERVYGFEFVGRENRGTFSEACNWVEIAGSLV